MIFTKKAVNKLGIDGDFLSLMKISTKYLEVISYLMVKYRMLFHLVLGTRIKISILSTGIHCCTGKKYKCNKRRKQNKNIII